MNQKQNDRVSYSFGMKLSLPAKYESADFHVSLTSDLNPGETVDQAFSRVKREVLGYAEKAYTAIRNSESGLEVGSNEPAAVQEVRKANDDNSKPTKRDPKQLRQQIKSAFAVLEAQKKIVKADFVKKYLNNSRVDDLSDDGVLQTLDLIRNDFKDLGL